MELAVLARLVIMGMVVVPSVVLGVLLLRGKVGAFLISGYKTKSDKKRAKYDMKALCRFSGRFMLALAFWFVVITLGLILEIPYWERITMPILCVGCIGVVFYVKGGKRFHKKEAVNGVTLSISNEAREKARKL
jgi:hypothetical protein